MCQRKNFKLHKTHIKCPIQLFLKYVNDSVSVTARPVVTDSDLNLKQNEFTKYAFEVENYNLNAKYIRSNLKILI